MTDTSGVLVVLRLVVSLAVVLVLLVALARWASKRGLGSARPGKATVEVEVLSRRSLGRSSTLQVVRVGTQVMVLGVTERGVSVLGELGEQDLVPAAPPLSVVPQPATYEAAQSRALADSLTTVDSRAAARQLRSARKAAPVPTGWPWNAAALVLGAGRTRRG
jgi:flagellar protein FliO/FliZ